MRNRIPSLSLLQSFEAAARYESFALAAKELSLSSGAVSRSISELENFTGIPLFDRQNKRVKLTEAGARYASKIRIHLEQIKRDTIEIQRDYSNTRLDIVVGFTICAQWLIPRLKGFYSLYPNIQLHLTGRDQPLHFSDSSFDATIYAGKSVWPGLMGIPLINNDDMYVVCSPELMNGKKLLSLSEIHTLPRITLRDIPYAWKDWEHKTAYPDYDPDEILEHRFEMYMMAINAAKSSLGIAIIPGSYIHQEIQSCQLVIAHQVTTTYPDSIYFAWPPHVENNEAFKIFSKWLANESDKYANSQNLRSSHP